MAGEHPKSIKLEPSRSCRPRILSLYFENVAHGTIILIFKIYISILNSFK